MQAHLDAVGCNGQEISRAHLAAIGCNGLTTWSSTGEWREQRKLLQALPLMEGGSKIHWEKVNLHSATPDHPPFADPPVPSFMKFLTTLSPTTTTMTHTTTTATVVRVHFIGRWGENCFQHQVSYIYWLISTSLSLSACLSSSSWSSMFPIPR